VEIAMLIDTLELRGLSAIAQVDLGRRQHRHQDTAALGRMAAQITQVVHQRAAGGRPEPATITQFARDGYGHYAPVTHVLQTEERPPMITVEGYGRCATKVS
jgi:glucosyl-3-phosphoglycerate synthase